MEQALFEKIKNSHYADYVSFAIWNDDDLTDLSVIENNIEALNQNIIIVGLNASGSIIKFQNFHCKHRGGRDSWLVEAFSHSSFRGAYMTDVIKNDQSSRQSSVDLSEDNILINIEEFQSELKFIECEEPYVITIGDMATGILRRHLPECVKKIHPIPHYAKRGIRKEDFIGSVKKISPYTSI